jgi:hypothetical protein
MGSATRTSLRRLRIVDGTAIEKPADWHDHVDGMDATHYPTRNVSATGWKQRCWMDGTLDATAGERTRTDSADSPATAS